MFDTDTSGDDEPVRAEFVIEPFVEGSPGPHVKAALEACRELGFEPDVGAFANTIDGAFQEVVQAVDALVRAAYDNGASAVQVRIGEPLVAARFETLHDALGRMIEGVEYELGGKLGDLSRQDKQAAVRMLDERGAFMLRRAVDSVGQIMGVSRITIYNYLNAIKAGDDG